MEQDERLDEAAELLEERAARLLKGLPPAVKGQVQEIRLRLGQALAVYTGRRHLFLGERGAYCQPGSSCLTVDRRMLEESYRRLCGYSVHSHSDQLAQGYVTARGGHRAGIAATAVTEGEQVVAQREISSICLRVARQFPGAADRLMGEVFSTGPRGVLLVGPPSSGKTTLLRDVARQFSCRGIKTLVVDERGERAASWEGIPQNDLGPCCDVLTGWPKAQGMLAGIRALSPQVVICDEIGGGEEAQAVAQCLGCGVQVVAAIHGESLEELWTRPQSRRLLATGAFSKGVLLAGKGRPGEILTIKDVTNDETSGNRHDRGLHGGPWPAAGLPDVRPCG